MILEARCPDCNRKHAKRNAKVPATPRQVDILRIVKMWRESLGYGPTLQDIADKLGISRVTAWEHVKVMRLGSLLVSRVDPVAQHRRDPRKSTRRSANSYRRMRSLDIAPNVLIPSGGKP